jgi:hypothetical protein
VHGSSTSAPACTLQTRLRPPQEQQRVAAVVRQMQRCVTPYPPDGTCAVLSPIQTPCRHHPRRFAPLVEGSRPAWHAVALPATDALQATDSYCQGWFRGALSISTTCREMRITPHRVDLPQWQQSLLQTLLTLHLLLASFSASLVACPALHLHVKAQSSLSLSIAHVSVCATGGCTTMECMRLVLASAQLGTDRSIHRRRRQIQQSSCAPENTSCS